MNADFHIILHARLDSSLPNNQVYSRHALWQNFSQVVLVNENALKLIFAGSTENSHAVQLASM